MKQLCDKTEPFKIKLTKLKQKANEYQCVFALAEITPQLTTINQIGRKLFERFDDPPYMPHLSFIYGKPDRMTLSKRQEAIQEIRIQLNKQFGKKRKKNESKQDDNEIEEKIGFGGINNSEIDMEMEIEIEFLVDRIEIWETPVGDGKCMEWDLFESFPMTGINKHKFNNTNDKNKKYTSKNVLNGQNGRNGRNTNIGGLNTHVYTADTTNTNNNNNNNDDASEMKKTENIFDERIDINDNQLKMRHSKRGSISLLTQMIHRRNSQSKLDNNNNNNNNKSIIDSGNYEKKQEQSCKDNEKKHVMMKDGVDEKGAVSQEEHKAMVQDVAKNVEKNVEKHVAPNGDGEEFEWDTESDDEATKLLLEREAISSDENDDGNMNIDGQLNSMALNDLMQGSDLEDNDNDNDNDNDATSSVPPVGSDADSLKIVD